MQDSKDLDRNVVVRYALYEDYLKMIEYEKAFEVLQSTIKESLDSYDPARFIVVVCLSGCGYLTCFKMKLLDEGSSNFKFQTFLEAHAAVIGEVYLLQES